MAGPRMMLHDLERGTPDSDPSHASHASSTKVGPSADVRADSSRSASPRHATNASPTPTPNHAPLEKLRAHIPPTVQTRSRTIWRWLSGPHPPTPWKVRPLLPRLQQLPLRLVDKVLPTQWLRIVALFIFYVCWISTFAAVLRKSSVVDNVNGYGQPILISCGAVFW